MSKLVGALFGSAMLAAPLVAFCEDVPDALAVEWQGKKLCENLYEDSQIRILRCIIPPGAIHVRHSHPPSFGYALSGGQGKVVDGKGTRQDTAITDEYWDSKAVSWHEYANTGNTTERFLVIEKKYQK